METAKIDREIPDRVVKAHLIAESAKQQIVLLGEINPSKRAENQVKDQLIYRLEAPEEVIPFAMNVDLEHIQIFTWDGNNLSSPICTLKTGAVLSQYDSSFTEKRIFHPYLTRLIEAWLRDLAYHWKTETPPASAEMAAIELLPLLAGGTTKTDVVLSGFVEE